jgi:hypothetical protein
MKDKVDTQLKQLLDSRSKLQRLIQQTEAQKKLVQAQEKALADLLAGKPAQAAAPAQAGQAV